MESNQRMTAHTPLVNSRGGSAKRQRKGRGSKATKKQKKNEDLQTHNPSNEEGSLVLSSSVSPNKKKKSTDVEEFVTFREAYLSESKDKPFVKCNVLEQFVKKKNLNFVTISMFPDDYELHCNVGNEIQKMGITLKYSKNQQQNFVFTQQLPKDIFNMLKSHGMVYESYVIAKIEKYLSHKEDNPILYNFIMLQEEGENSKSKICKKSKKKKILFNEDEIEREKTSFKSHLPYLNTHRPFAANKSLFKSGYYYADNKKYN